jgi:hypothetical protein
MLRIELRCAGAKGSTAPNAPRRSGLGAEHTLRARSAAGTTVSVFFDHKHLLKQLLRPSLGFLGKPD